jgi:hypothetical protein
MGSPTPATVSRASAILASVPAAVLEAAHSPFSARAVVCRMLLSAEPAERRRQLATIAREDRALSVEVESLARHGALAAATRLPLLEVCAASIAQLSPAQYASFRVVLAQLIAADGEVDRVEWTVRILLRQAVEGRGAARHERRPGPGGQRPGVVRRARRGRCSPRVGRGPGGRAVARSASLGAGALHP